MTAVLESRIPAPRPSDDDTFWAETRAKLNAAFSDHQAFLPQLNAALDEAEAKSALPPEPMTRAKAVECLDLLAYFGIHPTGDREIALEGLLG